MNYGSNIFYIVFILKFEFSTLIPRKVSSKYFTVDAAGNCKLVDEFKLEESCMKFGNNYVSIFYESSYSFTYK